MIALRRNAASVPASLSCLCKGQKLRGAVDRDCQVLFHVPSGPSARSQEAILLDMGKRGLALDSKPTDLHVDELIWMS